MNELKSLPKAIQNKINPLIDECHTHEDRLNSLLTAFLHDQDLISEYRTCAPSIKQVIEENDNNPTLKEIQTVFEHALKIKDKIPVDPLTEVEEIHNGLKNLVEKKISISEFIKLAQKKPMAIFFNPFAFEMFSLLEKVTNDELRQILSIRVYGLPLFHDARIMDVVAPMILARKDHLLTASLLSVKNDHLGITVIHDAKGFKQLRALIRSLPTHLLVAVLTKGDHNDTTPLHNPEVMFMALDCLYKAKPSITPGNIYSILTLKDKNNKTPMENSIKHYLIFKALFPAFEQMNPDEMFELITSTDNQRRSPLLEPHFFQDAIPLMKTLTANQIFFILTSTRHINGKPTGTQIMSLFETLAPETIKNLLLMNRTGMEPIPMILLQDKHVNLSNINQLLELKNLDLRKIFKDFVESLSKFQHFAYPGNTEIEYLKSPVINPIIAKEECEAILKDFGGTLSSLIRKSIGESAFSTLNPNIYQPTSLEEAKSIYMHWKIVFKQEKEGEGIKELDIAYGTLCLSLCKIFKIKGIIGSMNEKVETSIKIIDVLGNFMYDQINNFVYS